MLRSVAALIAFSLSPCAGQTVPQLLSTLAGATQFKETALSPDGHWLAWTVQPPRAPKDAAQSSEIWILNLADVTATPHRLTKARGPHSEQSPAFSPDNQTVAYLSDTEKAGQFQLFSQSVTRGAPRRLTSLTGFLATPRWAPDNHAIALLFTENAPRAAGPLEPATRDSGPVEDHFYEQRITLIDPHSSQVKAITPADAYVYEYDWAPDSNRLVYTASKGNGDNNWWIAALFTVNASSGEVRQIDKPAGQAAQPRWSPDGARIAFIGGIMSDEGSVGGDIFSVPATGGPEVDLTPGRSGSPTSLRWLGSGKILFTEAVDGGTAIATLNPSGEAGEALSKNDESWKSGDDTIAASADGKVVAAIRSSWTLAPEVWAGPPGEWVQRTHSNAALKPLWGRAESLHWLTDGAAVQGWLLYPVNFDPKNKYPLIVAPHGGPAAAKLPSWPGTHFDMSALSSQGYFVFFPNPRGSFGAGEAFTLGNVKDFGYGDLRDILGGVDEALRKLPIDPARIGIAGWSYGGYMTMWAVTQTGRFHAAVAGAGIANWQSYYGENLIDQWMIPYFGDSVYEDPAIYARSSPITYIRNAKTPTLLLVGDGDAECPPPQSYEFWHALKARGVKTLLVIYPGEGHAVRQPEHVKDVLERTIAWFNDNLKATAGN